MTFCVGIAVEDGLVGISDTRMLSGHESLIAKKVATYQGPGFSYFLMCSGLRSLRDKVLLAFDATRLCAVDVDYPIDVVLYQKNSFELVEHRYEREELSRISNWWQDRMRKSVHDLPTEWIDSAFSKLTRCTFP